VVILPAASFIKIPPQSTEITLHADQTVLTNKTNGTIEGRRNNGRPDNPWK